MCLCVSVCVCVNVCVCACARDRESVRESVTKFGRESACIRVYGCGYTLVRA